MDHSLTIEHATPDDLDRVTDLWVELAREQRAHDSAVLAGPNRDTMREVLAGHRFDGGLLVARADGTVVGFASFAVEHGALSLAVDRGTLSNLYVQPAFRNQGIGTRLLRAVEAELEARGVETLALEAMAGNDAARRFYRRAGYDLQRVTMTRRIDRDESDTHSKDGE